MTMNTEKVKPFTYEQAEIIQKSKVLGGLDSRAICAIQVGQMYFLVPVHQYHEAIQQELAIQLTTSVETLEKHRTIEFIEAEITIANRMGYMNMADVLALIPRHILNVINYPALHSDEGLVTEEDNRCAISLMQILEGYDLSNLNGIPQATLHSAYLLTQLGGFPVYQQPKSGPGASPRTDEQIRRSLLDNGRIAESCLRKRGLCDESISLLDAWFREGDACRNILPSATLDRMALARRLYETKRDEFLAKKK